MRGPRRRRICGYNLRGFEGSVFDVKILGYAKVFPFTRPIEKRR